MAADVCASCSCRRVYVCVCSRVLFMSVFACACAHCSEWKSEASMRVLDVWSKFVSLPDARSDASYSTIVGVSAGEEAAL